MKLKVGVVNGPLKVTHTFDPARLDGVDFRELANLRGDARTRAAARIYDELNPAVEVMVMAENTAEEVVGYVKYIYDIESEDHLLLLRPDPPEIQCYREYVDQYRDRMRKEELFVASLSEVLQKYEGMRVRITIEPVPEEE